MEMPDKADAENNSPVFLRQVAGLVFWITLVCAVAGGVVGVALGLTIGGVTFADAWTAGIRKRSGQSSFLNLSPMGWGIVVSLLLLVGFPLYALNRNSLKTRPGSRALFITVLTIGSLAFVAWAYSVYQLLRIGQG